MVCKPRRALTERAAKRPHSLTNNRFHHSSLDRIWCMVHICSLMSTVVEGDFEWDDVKAASNLTKHGVSFPEGATVFADPYAVYLDDASGAGRMVVIGASIRERLLCVVHVERGSRDRIISARKASPPEQDVYESGGRL
jgi:uncharacterized DUF497 family protein